MLSKPMAISNQYKTRYCYNGLSKKIFALTVLLQEFYIL
jgi:hypothetical protein